MENPIKMDDLGVPLFLETSIWRNHPNWLNNMFQRGWFNHQLAYNFIDFPFLPSNQSKKIPPGEKERALVRGKVPRSKSWSIFCEGRCSMFFNMEKVMKRLIFCCRRWWLWDGRWVIEKAECIRVFFLNFRRGVQTALTCLNCFCLLVPLT